MNHKSNYGHTSLTKIIVANCAAPFFSKIQLEQPHRAAWGKEMSFNETGNIKFFKTLKFSD